MDFLNELLRPSGLWENFIFGLDNIIKNYGVTLILITLIIKLAMSPLDFLNKYITKKNSRKQNVLKPELDKLKKRYANNQQLLNQKTMELYKRENYSVAGTCLGMLINMVLTMVVFFTLFSALNGISAYKQADEFTTLQNTYYATYNQSTAVAEEDKVQEAQNAVVAKYDEIKVGFLWINNIWRPDTSASVVSDYKTFEKATKDSSITEDEYNKIMQPVADHYNQWNGFYVLIILSAGTTFLSMQINTWISKRNSKKHNRDFIDPMGNNKFLVYLMPVIMAIFTLFYNAAFGIYIVTGGLFSLITGPFITMLADYLDKRSEDKENENKKISYSRK